MTERVNKTKHRRSLSLSKRKGTGKDGRSGSAGTALITSFFNNAPPPKVPCPLCCQLVPRYRINQHIDLQCQNFEREGTNAASVSNSDVPSVPLSPLRNPTKTSDQDPSSAQEDNKVEIKTSPYFKKHNSQPAPREMRSKSVVRTIDLGSFSSKLSRRCPKFPERTQTQNEDVPPCPEKGTSSEAPSSSQKENHLQILDDKGAHLKVIDLTSAIDVETPSIKPEPSQVERGDELEHKVSAPETLHPVVSLLSSPSSKQTKRKKGEISRSRMSPVSKKVKYEIRSKISEETFPGKDPVESADNNQSRAEEPSTDSCSAPLNYSSKEVHRERTTVMEGYEERTTTIERHEERTTMMAVHEENTPLVEVHEEESGPIKTAKDEESSYPPRSPYYLCNFRTVLEAVLENEDDKTLFNQDDLSLIDAFEKLSGMLKYPSRTVF